MQKDQLLFMDVVLFHPFVRKFHSIDDEFVTRVSNQYHIFYFDIYQWLSIVHNLWEVNFIKDQVRILSGDCSNHLSIAI